MTVTNSTTSTETDAAAALDASGAIVRCLPAAELTVGTPQSGAGALDQATPAPGSKAISATVSGAAAGTFLLVLSPDTATQVENGPVGPQDLVAGLTTAFSDATAALSGALGEVHLDAPQALDAEIALANANTFGSITVVPIVNAAGPAGSVVLLINRAKQQPAAAKGEDASFEPLAPATETHTGNVRAVELLNDVEMGVTAELGRTRMTVRELLAMQPGSVVELDRAAGSPVDLLVNGTIVARGEVVVIDEEFGIRITEIIGYDSKNVGK